MSPFLPNTMQWCKSSHFNIHHSLIVFSLLFLFLLSENRCSGLALVGPEVYMRYTHVKKCCNSWCPETSCLYIQRRFLTCNSGLEVENFIVKWLQEWLCFHIFAHFTDVWCQEVPDSVVPLGYKASLLAWQSMADCKGLSTGTMTWEIRKSHVVTTA